MDELDRKIVTAIQGGLPAEERPFDTLAARLGIDPEEMIARVRRLVSDGMIRRLGPVFDSRSLGYASTLVAARIPPERLAEVAARVNRLSGVTHNYERRHAYNLWFTLVCPSAAELERTIEALRRETGIPDFHSLPALTVYKIRVQFDLAGEPQAPQDAGGRTEGVPPPLDGKQRARGRLLQDGRPGEREPGAARAARRGWPTARVVQQIRAWLDSGVIRRFGAVVRHRELGFAANGMAAFRAAPDVIDAAGKRLAKHGEVSHCYRRPPLPDFPYNLFAMVHGQSEEEVRRTVAAMTGEIGVEDYAVLFSVTEFKKESMRYFPETA
ncbi:MAG: AsnC family transcriptional regulator [Planctomycetota bacterium]|nr:AsnC family transcriptional regulator [Planctomycetota bacterium]